MDVTQKASTASSIPTGALKYSVSCLLNFLLHVFIYLQADATAAFSRYVSQNRWYRSTLV